MKFAKNQLKLLPLFVIPAPAGIQNLILPALSL